MKDSDKPAEVDADDDANSTDWAAAAAAAVAVVAVQWKRKRLLCPSSSRQPTHVQHTAVSGGDSAQLCVVADKPATHPVSHLVSWRCDRWGISQASRLHPLPFRYKVETSALNLHCRFHIRTRMCMPAPDILRSHSLYHHGLHLLLTRSPSLPPLRVSRISSMTHTYTTDRRPSAGHIMLRPTSASRANSLRRRLPPTATYHVTHVCHKHRSAYSTWQVAT